MEFMNLIKEIRQIVGRYLFHPYETRYISIHYPSFDYIDFYCSEYDHIGDWRRHKRIPLPRTIDI